MGMTLMLNIQQSCICPPPGSPAHSPVSLMVGLTTPRRALASSVEDRTARTAAANGALTPASGRSISIIWMLAERYMPPGLQALVSEHTS